MLQSSILVLICVRSIFGFLPEQSDLLHSPDVRVYQSALQQPIFITGTGFASDLSLLLVPPLEVDVD